MPKDKPQKEKLARLREELRIAVDKKNNNEVRRLQGRIVRLQRLINRTDRARGALNQSVAEEATSFTGGYTPEDPGSNLLASMAELIQSFLGGQSQAQLPLGPRIFVPDAGQVPVAGFDPVVQSVFPRFNENQIISKGDDALSSIYSPIDTADTEAKQLISPSSIYNPINKADSSIRRRLAQKKRAKSFSRSKKTPTSRRFFRRYGPKII